MASIRSAAVAAVVLGGVLAAAPALGEVPAHLKAKRLTPADPAPSTLAVPEEPKVAILGSCTLATGDCSEYEGAFAGTDAPALCEKAKGNWSPSACPTEGSVGTCTQRQVGSEDRITTRSYPPATADAARKACVASPRGIFLKSR
jgi:hypothetical protein